MRRALYASIILSSLSAVAVQAAAQSTCFTQAQEIFRQRQWADAATAFAECEKSEPGKTDALLYRGKSLINLGHFEDAATALQNYQQARTNSDDAVYLLAYVRFRENKPEDISFCGARNSHDRKRSERRRGCRPQ